ARESADSNAAIAPVPRRARASVAATRSCQLGESSARTSLSISANVETSIPVLSFAVSSLPVSSFALAHGARRRATNASRIPAETKAPTRREGRGARHRSGRDRQAMLGGGSGAGPGRRRTVAASLGMISDGGEDGIVRPENLARFRVSGPTQYTDAPPRTNRKVGSATGSFVFSSAGARREEASVARPVDSACPRDRLEPSRAIVARPAPRCLRNARGARSQAPFPPDRYFNTAVRGELRVEDPETPMSETRELTQESVETRRAESEAGHASTLPRFLFDLDLDLHELSRAVLRWTLENFGFERGFLLKSRPLDREGENEIHVIASQRAVRGPERWTDIARADAAVNRSAVLRALAQEGAIVIDDSLVPPGPSEHPRPETAESHATVLARAFRLSDGSRALLYVDRAAGIERVTEEERALF